MYMSSEEPVVEVDNKGFFKQCETGTILSKYKELKEYRLSYNNSDDAVEDLVEVISEYLIGNPFVQQHQLQDTSKLNDILKNEYETRKKKQLQDTSVQNNISNEEYEKINPRLPLLTDKTNPFSFRDVIRHGGGNVLKDLLNPRQRTLNQIVRLFLEKQIRHQLFVIQHILKNYLKCIQYL